MRRCLFALLERWCQSALAALELSDGVRVTAVQAVSIRPLLSLVGPLGEHAEAETWLGA